MAEAICRASAERLWLLREAPLFLRAIAGVVHAMRYCRQRLALRTAVAATGSRFATPRYDACCPTKPAPEGLAAATRLAGRTPSDQGRAKEVGPYRSFCSAEC